LPSYSAGIAEVGKLLLESLQDSSAAVIAEALNSIFDIFAEPNVNSVFTSLDMLRVLEAFVPHLKNKVKTEKKILDRSMWDRLDEARINLVRFIQYKKQQF